MVLSHMSSDQDPGWFWLGIKWILLSSSMEIKKQSYFFWSRMNQAGIQWNVNCWDMSNEKYLGWLDYIGDYTTQLYRDYNKPL